MATIATLPTTAAQAAAPSAQVQTVSPPSTKAAAQATASVSTTVAQKQAALRQLLNRYTYDLSHGSDAAALAKLGRQITSAAKALGQHVTLPTAPTTQASAAPKSKVDVTA
ncbi:MAG TPA: hypothetical protein VL614_14010 [Acetobacteraceae bacterium]|jgi:hypothetical protein|nr:hypothetical protein [Acetobacteraceae bacterium]